MSEPIDTLRRTHWKNEINITTILAFVSLIGLIAGGGMAYGKILEGISRADAGAAERKAMLMAIQENQESFQAFMRDYQVFKAETEGKIQQLDYRANLAREAAFLQREQISKIVTAVETTKEILQRVEAELISNRSNGKSVR